MRLIVALLLVGLSACNQQNDPCGGVVQPTGKYGDLRHPRTIIIMESDTVEDFCRDKGGGPDDKACTSMNDDPHIVVVPRFDRIGPLEWGCRVHHELGHGVDDWPYTHPPG